MAGAILAQQEHKSLVETENRQLRQMQDQEYAQALEEDRKKREQAKKEQEEKQAAIDEEAAYHAQLEQEAQQRALIRQTSLESLPAEPEPSPDKGNSPNNPIDHINPIILTFIITRMILIR